MNEAMRILLVDDDEIDRMAVRRALRQYNAEIQIEEEGTGSGALKRLGRGGFDCVLLDYQLPDSDGLEVLQTARSHGHGMPFIMLTGHGDEELAVELMKAGASDYLVKGRLSLEGLSQGIHNAVRLHRAEVEAHRAQNMLRESEARFRIMADSAPVMIWMANPAGQRTYFNQVWLDFTGQTLEQQRGEAWLAEVHPQDRDGLVAAYRRRIGERHAFELDYRLRRGDGEYRWIVERGTPMLLPDGQISGYVGSCIDITERKQSEMGLQEAKEAAEAANIAKDKFLAVLSHELRTPLTPVLSTVLALLTEPEISDDVRSGLEMIRRNVELEARLIDDLLDLTRISKGKLQLNIETVDVHSAVKSALDICRSEIRDKDFQLHVQLDAEAHHVQADQARLQQVLWNLIKNAVKFTPRGGAITVRSGNPSEGTVRIDVADTGIGIDPQWLPRIFEAFEQGEGVINRQFGGLGLGLAICNALIGMHGGQLLADSAGRHQGATFSVELQTVQPPAAPADAEAPRRRRARREPLRILMVDDHADTNRAMKRLLERLGYDVETADSVESALQASQRRTFDLLISDIGLPDGSGLDLMRQINQSQPLKGIALSGFGMEDDLQRSREAGFAEHLTKPVNVRRLESAIQDLTASDV